MDVDGWFYEGCGVAFWASLVGGWRIGADGRKRIRGWEFFRGCSMRVGKLRLFRLKEIGLWKREGEAYEVKRRVGGRNGGVLCRLVFERAWGSGMETDDAKCSQRSRNDGEEVMTCWEVEEVCYEEVENFDGSRLLLCSRLVLFDDGSGYS